MASILDDPFLSEDFDDVEIHSVQNDPLSRKFEQQLSFDPAYRQIDG